MYKREHFDEWASTYDKSVQESERNNTYPFAGYSIIQSKIYQYIRSLDAKSVLEMGIGTGQMTKQLYIDGFQIIGVDFSIEMIEKARKIMPGNEYIHSDFINSLSKLKKKSYDVILFSYSIHHLLYLNQRYILDVLYDYLTCEGVIIIADVMTKSELEMNELAINVGGFWDDEEYYPIYDSLKKDTLLEKYDIRFEKVTFCSGIIALKKRFNSSK